MIETAFSLIRTGNSLFFGRPFHLPSLDRIIAALIDTRREFGRIQSEGADAFHLPALDEETLREVQLRRFRTQAVRAGRETAYYADMFKRIGLDPARLCFEDIQRLPLTTKEALNAEPGAFVCRTARPVYRAATTGTTMRPTSVYFSEHEMRSYIALGVIANLCSGEIGPDDIVQISSSLRATMDNTCLTGVATRSGAMVSRVGVVEPDYTLALLAEEHCIPGKKPRVSVLCTYPSYLGELTTCGLRLGYRPDDFGLERISLGGEIVTGGIKARCRQLFGSVQFMEGFGMTEVWPFGGHFCEEGHLHFDVSQGMLEVVNPETGTLARPGEVGTMVVTPFPPYRETTLLLRYDTQDMVRLVDGPLTCSLRHVPSTSNLLGKMRYCVHHDKGWTFPRQVMEALEAIEAVPLPARFSFRAVEGGISVQVVVPAGADQARPQIAASLEERGIPLRELHLLDDRSRLEHPFPLRCDLKETSFGRQERGASGEAQVEGHKWRSTSGGAQVASQVKPGPSV